MGKQKLAHAKKHAHAHAPQPAPAPSSGKDGIRETIESVVIAFVLAFLFRTFEAEAFVIPTGSMAPTLMGVHKDIECPECGYQYRVSASNEQDEEAERLRANLKSGRLDNQQAGQARAALYGLFVDSATCPNCRYTVKVELPDEAMLPKGKPDPRTYKGDRILVSKFPYEFYDPERWQVPVFKYPKTAAQNYIKRLVGLPNETITIHRGDLFSEAADRPRQIERKPPDKVQAIMQTVYDADHPSPLLTDSGWPARWQPLDDQPGWQAESERANAFSIADAAGERWIAYRHYVPSAGRWDRFRAGEKLNEVERSNIKPQLIGDYYGYDAGTYVGADDPWPGRHWVGDLILDCELEVQSAAGAVTFRLVRGGRLFDCRVDLSNGQATLSIDGVDDFQPKAETPIVGPGTYRVQFANVDQKLFLWVNPGMFDSGAVVFDAPTDYEVDTHMPTTEDLAPVRIGADGATLRVAHLRVLRDVYYIAAIPHAEMSDYEQAGPGRNAVDVAAFLSTPAEWTAFDHMRSRSYQLGEDQFFMLGDNSPQSADGRLWDDEHYVQRDLLVGKAVFVYWPHSWNVIPGTSIPFPFFPNFERMRLVR